MLKISWLRKTVPYLSDTRQKLLADQLAATNELVYCVNHLGAVQKDNYMCWHVRTKLQLKKVTIHQTDLMNKKKSLLQNYLKINAKIGELDKNKMY